MDKSSEIKKSDLIAITMAGTGVCILFGLLIAKLIPYLIAMGCVGLAFKIALSLRRVEQLRGRMLNLRRHFAERQELYDRACHSADKLSERDRQLAQERLTELRAYGRELIDDLRALLDETGAVKKEILAKLGETPDTAISRKLAPFTEVEHEIEQIIAEISATFSG